MKIGIQSTITLKRLILYQLFFLLMLILATDIKYIYAFDISGEYKGFYQYYDSRRNNIVGHFTIYIQQNGNRIKGLIKEPRTNFGPIKPFLYSDFTGWIEGYDESFIIQYTKVYRYDKHRIYYKGVYKSYLGEIQGTWNINSYKGAFKICNIKPTPDLDLEPPNILLIKPDFLIAENNTGSVRAIKVIRNDKIKTIEIVGFASDNVKIASVYVNDQKAYISSPNVNEQNIMSGNLVKFSSKLNLIDINNSINIEAIDVNDNNNILNFSIISSKESFNNDAPPVKTTNLPYNNKFAVVIGINNYVAWPPLECAVNDAISIKHFLNNQGYRVITLLDKEATRANILETLGYELPRLANRGDSVLVYFAGHGYTESLRDGGQEGYIVPIDAGRADCFLSAISMRQLRSITQRIKSKHILFLMDSCYSGLGFTRSTGLAANENDYIKKIASFRAVQMITAGGMNEQVIEQEGHGIFTKHLLKALKGPADFDNDGYITGSELGTYLRPIVTKESNNRQTPNYGRFEGEGEYIFNLNK